MSGTNLPKSVLVLNQDRTELRLIEDYLKKAGIVKVECRDDTFAAWRQFEKGKYDFLIYDWNIRGMSPLQLVNKVKCSKDFYTVPVLISAGGVPKDEFSFLSEFLCVGVLEKPLNHAKISEKLAALCAERAWIKSNQAILDKIVEAANSRGSQVLQAIDFVAKKSPNPTPVLVLAARLLLENNYLDQAKTILRQVLDRDPKCIAALNELGKIHHVRKEYDQALLVLTKAAELQPRHVERLCMLGEEELTMQNVEAARTRFQQAIDIDGTSQKAKAGLLIAKNLQEYLENNPRDSLPRSLASQCNMVAIGMIRQGRFAEGMKQYKSALVFATSAEDSAKVAYNMGLGYVQWKRLEDALNWFHQSLELSQGTFTKAAKPAKMLEDALQRGAGSTGPKAVATAGKASSAMPAAPSPAPASGPPPMHDEELAADLFGAGEIDDFEDLDEVG